MYVCSSVPVPHTAALQFAAAQGMLSTAMTGDRDASGELPRIDQRVPAERQPVHHARMYQHDVSARLWPDSEQQHGPANLLTEQLLQRRVVRGVLTLLSQTGDICFQLFALRLVLCVLLVNGGQS